MSLQWEMVTLFAVGWHFRCTSILVQQSHCSLTHLLPLELDRVSSVFLVHALIWLPVESRRDRDGKICEEVGVSIVSLLFSWHAVRECEVKQGPWYFVRFFLLFPPDVWELHPDSILATYDPVKTVLMWQHSSDFRSGKVVYILKMLQYLAGLGS